MTDYSRLLYQGSLYAKGGFSAVVLPKNKPADSLSNKFSGVIINQGSGSTDTFVNEEGFTQEFELPSDYKRIDKVPSLTGFQTYVNLDGLNQEVSYKIYRYDNTVQTRIASVPSWKINTAYEIGQYIRYQASNETPVTYIAQSKISISAASASGYTYTYTVPSNAGLSIGQLISISGSNVAAYNGMFTITDIPAGGTTFKVTGLVSNPTSPTFTNGFCNSWATNDSYIATDSNNNQVKSKNLKTGDIINIDKNYDSEKGWVGIAEGITSSGLVEGDQWLSVKFKSLTIDSSWVNQKFKIVIYSDSIKKVYCVAPTYPAYKIDGVTALSNSGTVSTLFRVLASTADDGVDLFNNKVRSIAREYSNQNITSDSFGFWSSKPNPSKYAVESLYFNISDSNSNPSVINSIFLNPITPGVVFHVYYSNDPKGPGTNDASWESLLWEPVPKTFKTNKKQSYVLPTPITARYIKIEFSSLQAEFYNPGNYQIPVLYKKYPTWVLNYFLFIYNLNYNKTYDPIISDQIDIEYDALSLAFNYYRGDIIQSPAGPVTINNSNTQNNIVANFLRNAGVDLQDYDSASLSNINTLFNTYTNHPGYTSKTDTVVGKAALTKSINEFFNYSTEQILRKSADTGLVSTADRNHLLIEKKTPDMHFYTICRHGYREAYAKFENNKAYFVKIQEIRFERNNNNVISDQNIYKFTPGDQFNYEHSELTFNESENAWTLTS